MNTKEIMTLGHKIYDLHVYSLKSYEEISILLNISNDKATTLCAAYCRLAQRKIPVYARTGGRNRELEKQIVGLKKDGKSLKEISEIVHKSASRCGQIIKRYEKEMIKFEI